MPIAGQLSNKHKHLHEGAHRSGLLLTRRSPWRLHGFQGLWRFHNASRARPFDSAPKRSQSSNLHRPGGVELGSTRDVNHHHGIVRSTIVTTKHPRCGI